MSTIFPDPQQLLAHEAGLRRLACSLLRDRDLADDAVQDTWLAALDRETPPEDSASWLRGVTRRVAMKSARREARRERRERKAARSEDATSVERIREREATRRSVLEAVLGLAEPYRHTVLLRFFESLPPREIARRDGVPTETVRTRLRRGMEQVRERLERELGRNDSRGAWPLIAVAFDRASGQGTTSVVTQIIGVSAVTTKAKLMVTALVVLIALPLIWFGSFNEEAADDGSPAFGGRESAGVTPADEIESPPPRKVGGALPIPTTPFSADEPATAKVASSAAHGSLLLSVVWKKDASPANGVEVELIPWGGPDPLFRTLWGRTNERGELRFERLPAGTVGLSAHFGGRARAKIKAGEEVAATLEIPEGWAIDGQVVDANDLPVKGAQIVLSNQMSMNRGRVVGRSNAEGRFKIASVGSKSWRTVGARAEGFAPTPMTLLSATAGERQEVKIVLKDEGGTVEGQVLDPDGNAVVGARVKVGKKDFAQFGMPDGRVAMAPGPIETRTDEAGRFRVAGMAVGPTPVAVRALDLAPWTGSVDVVPRTVRSVEVALDHPATLSGTILDAEGEPAPKVQVQVNRYGSFLGSSVLTGADGRYELGGLASGEMPIFAESDKLGRATTTLQAAPGEALIWNARLGRGGKITGQVLDEANNPLAGWSILIQGISGKRISADFAQTDENGHFTLQNCRNPSYRLEVSERLPGEKERFSSRAALRLLDVRPDGDPLRLVVPRDKMSTVWVTGRIIAPDGTVIDGTHYSIHDKGRGNADIERVDIKTGRFRSGPFPAGTYSLSAEAPGVPRYHSEWHTTAPGETLDLGTIRFSESGRIQLTVEGLPENADLSKVWLRAKPIGGRGQESIDLRERTVTSGPLAPGRYELWISGPVIARDRVEFEITEGRVTELTIVAREGTPQMIRVGESTGGEPLPEVHLVIHAADGRLIGERTIKRRGARPLEWHTWLGPGQSYRVTATAGSLTKTATLEVAASVSSDPTAAAPVFEISLR